VEATPGTAEALTASEGVFNAYDVMLQPSISLEDREGSGSFNYLTAIPQGQSATLTFKTDLAWDGSATEPTIFSVLMPACGWTETTNVWKPRSEAPGTNVKTLTMYGWVEGRRKKMIGCAGNAKIVLETGKIAVMEFEFKGVWVGVDDTAIIAPTYPAIAPLRCMGATFTLGSWAPCMAKLEIDLGNEVILRECQTATYGFAAAIITNRMTKGSMDPESALIASADPFGDMVAGTERALAYSIQDANDKFALAAPKCQITNISYADRKGMEIDQVSFDCNRSAAAGNDELTITFSAP